MPGETQGHPPGVTTEFFDERIPLVRDQTELDAVKARFAELDPYYVASAAIPERRATIEALWRRFEPYADIDFRSQYKTYFAARVWEMYLGVVLLDQGMELSAPQRGEPDVHVVDPVECWLEAVAVNAGKGPDALTPVDTAPSERVLVQEYPEDQFLLRVCAAVSSKRSQAVRRLENGVVADDEPSIIALNAASLSLPDSSPSVAMKVTFGVGALHIPLDGAAPYYAARRTVRKQNGSDVALGLFRNEEYDHISALLFSNTTVISHPGQRGTEFIVVHNPRARPHPSTSKPSPSRSNGSRRMVRPSKEW